MAWSVHPYMGMENKPHSKKPTRREAWQGMNWIRQDKRLAIYLRDGLAMWCGATIEDGAILTLDHVRPHSDGGSNSERNLVCACKRCNSSRGDRKAEDFAAAVAGYVNHGVDAEGILAAIASTTRKNLKPHRAEAKEMIARRGSAAKALAQK